jgi:flagellin-specific chaperone FliS
MNQGREEVMEKTITAEIPSNDVDAVSGEIGTPLAGESLTATQVQRSTAARAYKKDQISNLTPVQVIDKLYGVAIMACKKKDLSLAQKAVSELIVGLNFEYQEISTPLFRLYRYCKDRIREGKPEEAIMVLTELRAAWAQAFHLSGG